MVYCQEKSYGDMQYKALLTLLAILVAGMARSQPLALAYPAISGYGGIVPLEGVNKPTSSSKVVVDIVSGKTTRTGVNSSLNTVARLINLYAYAGVAPGQMKVAVVIHGAATDLTLSKDAYMEKFNQKHPADDLMEKLAQIGVKLWVCGQSYAKKGFGTKQRNPNVSMALSAMTTLVQYQTEGYVLLKI